MATGFGESNKKYLFLSINCMSNTQTDNAIAAIQSAQSAGFTDVIFFTSSTLTTNRLQQTWINNYKAVLNACKTNGLTVTLGIPDESSGEHQFIDPDMSAAYPTWGYFYVSGGYADLIADPAEPATIWNGGWESDQMGPGDNYIAGCRSADVPYVSVDDTVSANSGGRSLRFDLDAAASQGYARIRLRPISVVPWRHYRITAWVYTDGVSNPNSFTISPADEDGTRYLDYVDDYANNIPSSTDDWFRVDVVFNSLEVDTINLWVGCYGKSTGTLWLDDLEIAQVGLLNVIRRDDFESDSAPLVVQSSNGQTTYVEGVHFARVTDPLNRWSSGSSPPYAKNNTYWRVHEDPSIEIIDHDTIPDGTTLKVSWYHPLWVKTYMQADLQLPEAQAVVFSAVDYVNALYAEVYGAACQHWMCGYDELRMGGANKWYSDTGATPAQALGWSVNDFWDKIRTKHASADLLLWSDMFNPYQNAVDKYYLWKGDLTNAHSYISHPFKVYNWTTTSLRDAANWFSARYINQIISINVRGTGQVGFESYTASMTTTHDVLKGGPSLSGVGYTTWAYDYSHILDFGAQTTAWYTLEKNTPYTVNYSYDDAKSLFFSKSRTYEGLLPRPCPWFDTGDETEYVTADQRREIYDSNFWSVYIYGIVDDIDSVATLHLPVTGYTNFLDYLIHHPELPITVSTMDNRFHWHGYTPGGQGWVWHMYAENGKRNDCLHIGWEVNPTAGAEPDTTTIWNQPAGPPPPEEFKSHRLRYLTADTGQISDAETVISWPSGDGVPVYIPLHSDAIPFWTKAEELSYYEYMDDNVQELLGAGLTPAGFYINAEDMPRDAENSTVKAKMAADPRFDFNTTDYYEHSHRGIVTLQEARTAKLAELCPWWTNECTSVYGFRFPSHFYGSYPSHPIFWLDGRKLISICIYPYYLTLGSLDLSLSSLGYTALGCAETGIHLFHNFMSQKIFTTVPSDNLGLSVAGNILWAKACMALGAYKIWLYLGAWSNIHAYWSTIIGFDEMQPYHEYILHGENYIPPRSISRPHVYWSGSAFVTNNIAMTLFYGKDSNGADINEHTWICCRIYGNHVMFFGCTSDGEDRTINVTSPFGTAVAVKAGPLGDITIC
jgi:hypothetical protein